MIYNVQRLWFAAIVLLLTVGQAGATEYFVTRQGDDSQAGTSKAMAFATIQAGVDALEPGDTLTIGPGEYFEHVRREGIGNSEVDTVIRAEMPGTVLLRGDRPAPRFTRVPDEDYVHVADFDGEQVSAVMELDTLSILQPMPNATELAYQPGKFHYDAEAGKLYIATTDWRAPSQHRYSVSVTPTHGFYLSEATRVIIDGLSVTGFKAAAEQPRQDHTLNSTWGIFINGGKDCLIRNCRAYLNGQGIGLNSHAGRTEGYGRNVIEQCAAWGNASDFGVGDRGGITLIQGHKDVVRDSRSFLNGRYGINIRGGKQEHTEAERSRLVNNITWGNGAADVKIKTGHDNLHTTERTFAPYPSNDYDPVHCLLGTANGADIPANNIVLDEHDDLNLEAEFADPANHDYRLQATSRFRGAAPDGSDKGPYPYEPNIRYVAADGDDDADGLSMQHAWATLAHAFSELNAGDTLYIEPGTYSVSRKTEVSLAGTAEAPILVRGRGHGEVTLRGASQLAGSRHVVFERLRFESGVNMRSSEAVTFKNCRFLGGEIALDASDSEALTVRHGEFTSFTQHAIDLRGAGDAHLAGNVYDNQQDAAIRLSDLDAVRYSDYNTYRAGQPAWEVATARYSLQQVRQDHEPHAVRLNGDARLAARGPLGRPLGPYRDAQREQAMRLVQTPTVHKISATTANIEWRTSVPADVELGWGPTPDCENRDTFAVNRFGTFSLTGLEPGKTYYFRLLALKEPLDILQASGIDPIPDDRKVVPLESETLSFTTATESAAPSVYFVAPDGDDANSGRSRDEAWRTVAHAASQVNAGDTVRIAGGTYSERVRIRATGAADAPITFESLPGEKVVFSGANKQLGQVFVAAGKKHLRFDGFYFTESSREPLSGWHPELSAEFNLYRCEDLQITRCFSDTPSGYSARFLVVWQVKDLHIKNCVTINKMSGAMNIWRSPNLRIENSVFARQLISTAQVNNLPDQTVRIEDSIFTDMLAKKARLNISFMSLESAEALELENNAFFVREFPPNERHVLMGVDHTTHTVVDRWTIAEFEEAFGSMRTVMADPQFAGDPSEGDGYGIDRMMHPDRGLDFDDFFATNPELVERGIGLEREAFADFTFNAEGDAATAAE